MSDDPDWIDSQQALLQERSVRRSVAGTQSASSQSDPGDDEEVGNGLLGDEADVPRGIRQVVGKRMDRQRQPLMNADRQFGPIWVRVAQMSTHKNFFNQVVGEDHEDSDTLDPVDPWDAFRQHSRLVG